MAPECIEANEVHVAFVLVGILVGLVGLGLSRWMSGRRIKARRRGLAMTVEERVAFERYVMRAADKSDSNDHLRPRG